VAQITDLDILEANAKHGSRSDCSRTRSSPPTTTAVEQNFHREILALIPRLTRYARVLTRDTVAADDLVQDCLARALGKIHLWEEGTDLRAWLFTILHHQHISHARRDARRRSGMERQKSHPSLTLSPSQTVRLEFRDLERAMAKLPEEQRSVILLVGLEGMGYDEAASVVKTPVGTVRSRVARGRETLRAMTGLFPGRHSPRPGKVAHLVSPRRPKPSRNDVSPDRTDSISAPKSQEVVQ
jgi:RNA polymerase sigma-70 factor (ECF subfamily)